MANTQFISKKLVRIFDFREKAMIDWAKQN